MKFILLLAAVTFALLPFARSQTGNIFDSDNQTGIAFKVRATTVSAAYTATARDHLILVDASTAAVTVTLPTAVGYSNNRVIVVKKLDSTANVVTLDPAGAELADSRTTLLLVNEGDAVTLEAANGAWHSIGVSGEGRQSLIPAATLTNGTATAKTQVLMDDTPAAEFSALTLVGAQPTLSQTSTKARKGTNSLKAAFTAAASANDGFQWTAFSAVDWTTAEYVGFWVYSSKALTAGDVMLKTVDSTVESAFSFGAVPANTWTWVQLDISSLATTNGDAVTNYKVYLSTAGAALGAFDLYLDGAWKWDNTEEVALGVDLLDRRGSVENALSLTAANTGTHGMVALTEDTDFFVAYRAGNDALVTISDLSTKAALFFVNRK
jgi:hypothetical protein